MTTEEARKILGLSEPDKDGYSSHNGNGWIDYVVGDSQICLDGRFNRRQLEAALVLLKNN